MNLLLPCCRALARLAKLAQLCLMYTVALEQRARALYERVWRYGEHPWREALHAMWPFDVAVRRGRLMWLCDRLRAMGSV